jgi:hypothetical protein
MFSIFLCHSSKDKPFAASLASKLAAEDIKVWLDEAEIKIGDFLSEKIRSAIDEMSCFAVILSNNSIGSQWVERDLQTVIQKELVEKRVVILPLLLNEVDLPTFLREKKYADFTEVDRLDESYEQLLTVLKPIATQRFADNTTSFESRRVIRKKTNTRCQVDGNDIVIVDISKENLGFLSNIQLIYNEVHTINIKHDYLSEIIRFVVTRPMIADKKTGFNYFIGADILERDIHI